MVDRRKFLFGASALSISLPLAAACGAEEANRRLPEPTTQSPRTAKTETAVLAGGCFWGIQGLFAHVKGVTRSVSGYSGGAAADADYELVSTGRTGHAEAVQVTFDPRVISYGQILQIFFSVGTDPTQLNQQFPDVGPQYRNEIFYLNADQKRVAEAYIAQLNQARAFPRTIVTKVTQYRAFYRAEAYHQDYLMLNPTQPYIARYDLPKIQALRKIFPEVARTQPLRLGGA